MNSLSLLHTEVVKRSKKLNKKNNCHCKKFFNKKNKKRILKNRIMIQFELPYAFFQKKSASQPQILGAIIFVPIIIADIKPISYAEKIN